MSRKSRVRAPPGPPNHQASAHAPCHFVFIFFVWFFWAQHWVFKNSLLLLLCFPFAELFFTRTTANPLGVSLNTYIKQKGIVYRKIVNKGTEQGKGEREREITTENAKNRGELHKKKERAPVHNAHVTIRYSWSIRPKGKVSRATSHQVVVGNFFLVEDLGIPALP